MDKTRGESDEIVESQANVDAEKDNIVEVAAKAACEFDGRSEKDREYGDHDCTVNASGGNKGDKSTDDIYLVLKTADLRNFYKRKS